MRLYSFHSNQDEGTVFVWVAVLCAMCMMVALGVANLGNAARSVALAQNAADAAALSAAYEVAHLNSDQACSSARIAAKNNHALTTSCRVTDSDVFVEVKMKNDSSISAKARAEIE